MDSPQPAFIVTYVTNTYLPYLLIVQIKNNDMHLIDALCPFIAALLNWNASVSLSSRYTKIKVCMHKL